MIVDGQNTIDWRKGLEESYVHILLITEGFFEDALCIEQTIFAKEHNVPVILLVKKGVELEIPDLFDGMNIKGKFYFDDLNKHEVKKEMNELMKKIRLEQ